MSCQPINKIYFVNGEMKTDGEKLEYLREHLGLTQSKFAKKLGIKDSFYSSIKTGSSVFPRERLNHLMETCGINLNWFITGNGEPFLENAEKNIVREPGPINRVSGPVAAPPIVPDTGSLDPDAFDLVPLAEARLSAGGGSFVQSEGFCAYYAFKKEWLRRIADGGTDNLVLVKVSGDSMHPTIDDGDMVLVDTARLHIRSGAIYAIGIDDTIAVKRIDLAPPATVNIISDNKLYQPYTAALDQVRILGQVIWFARELI
jgi:phage repressor protein C with HTH and peptisase S24 domain